MKLSDLNPGDVFRYLDGRPEFLSGLFMKMHQKNTYISPMTKKRRNFIISLNDGMPYNHADRREVEIILKYKERTMENKMNHFIGWKFGVPVKVYNRNGIINEGRLTRESVNSFSIYWTSGGHVNLSKTLFRYELIPYKYEGRSGGVFNPRYPVCQAGRYIAFCNANNQMIALDAGENYEFKPYLATTLIIDGKTIELSAETTAELKKKLGI